ncbi:MAG TPA: hypothetical protein VMA33_09910 [Candidatus Tectomicrobia bacterium]|nr:hypothetical protein [Candidatus Tectomicrobia bacterium]
MKKALLTIVEPTRATLLIVLAIGLGIEVHPVFFVVVLAIAMAVLAQAIVNALEHRHP